MLNPVGQETPPANGNAPVVASPWAPIVERVGVPLFWIALGYGLCKLTQKPRSA